MGHEHEAYRTSAARPFDGPISESAYNPAAHGGVAFVDYCRCGSQRERNVNGRHQEIGAWDLPTEIPNVQTCAATPAMARRYLVIMARSAYGRELIERAGYSAILSAPERGDDESTMVVARRVDSLRWRDSVRGVATAVQS